MTDLSKNIVDLNCTILDALAVLNEIAIADYQTLFVIDSDKKLVGSLTDGDIRRALLNGAATIDPIETAMCREFHFLTKSDFHLEQILELKKSRILLVPMLDDNDKILRIVDFNKQRSILPVDSVIMAGGKGERLKPLTLNTPKPLLEIGGKAIIEHNVERLARFGINHITIATGFLSEKLIEFFENKKYNSTELSFTIEEKKLGTIGALSLIKKFYHDIILVINADILTNIDLEDFLISFIREKCILSVATIPYKISVPYAVLETAGDSITAIKEKPTYTYYANAGIYLMHSSIINYIPKNEYFDATDLIEILIEKKHKVHHFPVKGYWLDIGKMEDFKKAQEDIKMLTD